jgi:hypothetical protein
LTAAVTTVAVLCRRPSCGVCLATPTP